MNLKQDSKGNFIGEGEDSAVSILQKLTCYPLRDLTEYPLPGIYRQVPISIILDDFQLKDLAEFHKKSSVDILMMIFTDYYLPRLNRIAVRVEGKKSDLKMQRQAVQARLLSKWCQVVDIHKRECPELFKERINEKSIQEVEEAFKTAKVTIPMGREQS